MRVRRRGGPGGVGLALLALLWAGGAGSEDRPGRTPACQARVALDPVRAVVGQQVLYRVRIGSRDDVQSVEWESPPGFPGLRTELLPGDPQPALAEPWPGRRVRDERRALFAELPGRYRLEAPGLRCRLADGASRVVPVPVAVLEVVPPPTAGRPDGYAGLVGAVGLHVTVTPRQLTLGESLRVAVMLRGEGNLWVLAPPFDAASFPGSELFARRPEQEIDRGRRLSLRRHFVWDVVPRSVGPLRVPALALPYFDPARGAYALARSEAVEVDVLPRPVAPQAPAPRPSAPPGPAATARERDVGDAALLVMAALLLGLGLGLWRWRARATPGRVPSVRSPRDAGEADEATRLDRALRAALAHHVADAASVTPQELIARDPQDPAVASAAHLLAALERARFDPQAPPPDAAAVQRAIASL